MEYIEQCRIEECWSYLAKYWFHSIMMQSINESFKHYFIICSE